MYVAAGGRNDSVVESKLRYSELPNKLHPKLGSMEYNARVCNHKYIQHEGEAPGLYVLVVTVQYKVSADSV